MARESDDEILGTVVSDQGRYVVSWPKGDELSLWNNTGDLLQQFSIDKRIRSAVFNKDGNKILAWTRDGAYIWDINGALLQEFSLGQDALRVAMFNPTEDKILTLADDGKSILWNLEGEKLAEFTHTDKQSIRRKRVMFTQNSERIVSWGPDSMIKFWDYSGGLIEYVQQEEAAEEIILNSKEDYMLSWRENRARLWNLHLSQSKNLSHNDYIKGAIFNEKGDKILIWSNDDKARLWNLEGIMIAEFQHSGATDGIHG
ncbi:MAG: WD40 repeat domain-containing protein, partial [Bacteroidota bacterium]